MRMRVLAKIRFMPGHSAHRHKETQGWINDEVISASFAFSDCLALGGGSRVAECARLYAGLGRVFNNGRTG